jgi:hypothetical protein
MFKKEIWIPLAILALFIIFGVVSLALRLYPSKRITAAKLRIGGLILSLSMFASCGSPQPTCYDVASPPDSTATKDSIAVVGIDSTTTDTVATTTKKNKKSTKPADNIDLDSASITRPPEMIRCYVPPDDDL